MAQDEGSQSHIKDEKVLQPTPDSIQLDSSLIESHQMYFNSIEIEGHQVDSILQTHLLHSDMNLTDPKTPEKSSSREKDLSNSTLKSCARDFGCVTPKTKFKKVNRTTIQNSSMVAHLWAKSSGMNLETDRITDKDLEKLILFGGPGGINLLSEGIDISCLKKFLIKSGVIGPNGLHVYPKDCIFYHCMLLKEWCKKNNIETSSPKEMGKLLVEFPIENLDHLETTETRETVEKTTETREKVCRYFCPEQSCSASHTRRHNVIQHIKRVHKGLDFDPKTIVVQRASKVKCSGCSRELNKRYLKEHLNVCNFKVKKLALLDTQHCKECNLPKTQLKFHLMTQHKYELCHFCLSKIGPPCYSCKSACCESCSRFPKFCCSCTIDAEGNSILVTKKIFLAGIEGPCSFCKSKSQICCQSCDSHICKTCEKEEGFCKLCVIEADSDFEEK